MNSKSTGRTKQSRSSGSVSASLLLLGAFAFFGCNLLTGVSRLEVADDDGAGGNSEGGASNGDGGGALGGGGGVVVLDCDVDNDCEHPDGCLLGDCQDGSCFYSLVTCEEGRICEDGACLCDEGTVDCDGTCLSGVCCPGETDGGCGNCGVLTCSGDRSAFECLGEGACKAGEVCNAGTLNEWSDGTSCGCGLQAATCSQTCEKGACQ